MSIRKRDQGGQLAELVLGDVIIAARSPRAGKRDFPILSMTMAHGLVPQDQKFKKRVASEDTSAYKVVRRGQLVVGFPIDEGVLAFQDLHGEAIISPAYDVWDIRAGVDVWRPFLQRYLRSPEALRFFAAKLQSTTARRRSLPDDLFLALPVPLPPLAEQRRIAAILDEADALRAKRRAALEQLDEMARAIFVEMFGDPLAPSQTTGTRSMVRFEDVTTRITYGFTSPMEHFQTGIPILTAKNVQDGFIDFENVHYASRKQFDALTAKAKPRIGDILITKDGTIGRCAVVERDTDFCINQSVALVQLNRDKVLPTYVAAYIRVPSVQAALKGMGKGNALLHLQITELAKMPIAVPSTEMQLRFEEQRETVAGAHAKARDAERALDRLFASLQHRAFRGEF